MFMAHELIAVLNPESQDYADCMAAVKFDIGDNHSINRMVEVSRMEFFEIPATICLFQVTQAMDDCLY